MDNLPIADLSLVLIAGNEEHRIKRCLESAHHLASEIILVTNAKDNTINIAKSYGAKIFQHEWRGYRDQKNLALEYVNLPWVLALDCDEELSPVLQNSIKTFFSSHQHKNYETAHFPRKVWFMGRWITHGDWYPDYSTRIFKKGVQWTGSPEHDKIDVPGPSKKLDGDCHHFTNPTITDMLEKIKIFSGYFLERQLDQHKTWSLLHTIFRPWWRFVRSYIIRLGFLDGFPGFFIACATSFAALVRYSRLFEHHCPKDPP
jgi:glycosyltransferase involved in cell wall biosynthesis